MPHFFYVSLILNILCDLIILKTSSSKELRIFSSEMHKLVYFLLTTIVMGTFKALFNNISVINVKQLIMLILNQLNYRTYK